MYETWTASIFPTVTLDAQLKNALKGLLHVNKCIRTQMTIINPKNDASDLNIFSIQFHCC